MRPTGKIIVCFIAVFILGVLSGVLLVSPEPASAIEMAEVPPKIVEVKMPHAWCYKMAFGSSARRHGGVRYALACVPIER